LAGQKPFLAGLRDYFTATRRPLYSVIIAAPFFADYELGIAFLYPRQPEEARARIVAADVLQSVGSAAGRHIAYLLPVVAGMALLLYLDWRERHERRARAAQGAGGFRPAYITWMCAESLMLALPLRLASSEIVRMFAATAGADAAATPRGSLLFELTTYCGAGAYEELLFRRFLFMGLFWVGRLAKLEKLPAGVLAAVVAGAIFAFFHPQGNFFSREFSAGFFVFATLAGVYFSVICLYRSFGMAVATHASYDIMSVLARLAAG
jgi:hypothetical protein